MGDDGCHILRYGRYQRNESYRSLLVWDVDGYDFQKRQSGGIKGHSLRPNRPLHGDHFWRFHEYRSSPHAFTLEERRLLNLSYGLVPSHKHLVDVDPLHGKRHWILHFVTQNSLLVLPQLRHSQPESADSRHAATRSATGFGATGNSISSNLNLKQIMTATVLLLAMDHASGLTDLAHLTFLTIERFNCSTV